MHWSCKENTTGAYNTTGSNALRYNTTSWYQQWMQTQLEMKILLLVLYALDANTTASG